MKCKVRCVTTTNNIPTIVHTKAIAVAKVRYPWTVITYRVTGKTSPMKPVFGGSIVTALSYIIFGLLFLPPLFSLTTSSTKINLLKLDHSHVWGTSSWRGWSPGCWGCWRRRWDGYVVSLACPNVALVLRFYEPHCICTYYFLVKKKASKVSLMGFNVHCCDIIVAFMHCNWRNRSERQYSLHNCKTACSLRPPPRPLPSLLHLSNSFVCSLE